MFAVRMSAAACVAASLAGTPAMAQARLQDVLSAATLSFGDDGGRDRAVLVQNGDGEADLYIYRGADADKAPQKPAFFKKSLVFAGTMWGQSPTLSVNKKGSLVIQSENVGVGRNKWEQSLTVILRKGTFVVAGITYSSHDTLDPNAGGSCDVNLLTGKAVRNGKPAADKIAPIDLANWSDEKLPKPCQF